MEGKAFLGDGRGTMMKAPHCCHLPNGGAQLGVEERSPQLDGGEDAEVAFAHPDEGGQKHHSVGCDVMRLEMVELEERAEKAACRQAEAMDEVRAEDNPLALPRRRRDLPRRRHARLHVAHAGKTPRLTEESDVILIDI